MALSLFTGEVNEQQQSVSPFTSTFKVRFKNKDIVVRQIARERNAEDDDHTGSFVWPCCSVSLRFLEQAFADDDPTAGVSSLSLSPCRRRRLLDLSAGAGAVSLAVAVAIDNCLITACDIPSQIPHLTENLHSTSPPEVREKIRIVPFSWGQSISPLLQNLLQNSSSSTSSTTTFDYCIASDLIYIALRDNCTHLLKKSLQEIARHCSKGVLLLWEPRRGEEEMAFVQTLQQSTKELDDDDDTTFLCTIWQADTTGLVSSGVGHPDTNIFVPTLFDIDAPEVWCALLTIAS